jgi:hypothetical protein
MARITTSHAWQKHLRVLVLPGSTECWQVVIEGHVKPSHFTDQNLALNYAQLWAASNCPSTVLVYGAGGSLEDERTFGMQDSRSGGAPKEVSQRS